MYRIDTIHNWKHKWNTVQSVGLAGNVEYRNKVLYYTRVTKLFVFLYAIADKNFSHPALLDQSHRRVSPLSIAVAVRYMAQVHNIHCIWQVQRWNSDSALFPCSCLIFQMLQSHIFGQRADLATECRTLSRDLSIEWHRKAACCSVPRQPRADRSQLQLLHWHGTFINTREERWILPLCSFFHDELFPGRLSPTFFLLLHFLKYSVQLNTSVCERWRTSDPSKQHFLMGTQINASKDLWNLPQPLVYYYAKNETMRHT